MGLTTVFKVTELGVTVDLSPAENKAELDEVGASLRRSVLPTVWEGAVLECLNWVKAAAAQNLKGDLPREGAGPAVRVRGQRRRAGGV